MKTKFALLLLAVMATSTFAEGRERLLKPVEAARAFSDLRPTAEVVKQGARGYMKIAQGDVICERWPKAYNSDSLMPFDYTCTVYEEDPILPAYPEAAPRARARARARNAK